jgi:hypothetical protein
LAQVVAVVGQERDPREMLGDLGVGATETVGELLAQFRAPGVAHDHGCHGARPSQEVRVEHVEQTVDVRPLEATDVVAFVHVTRRRAHHHETAEAARILAPRDCADHRADGMTDEHRIVNRQRLADVQDVVRVALECCVPRAIERRRVRLAMAHVVEQHEAKIIFERRYQVPPHALVATETVRQQHGARTLPEHADVVTA